MPRLGTLVIVLCLLVPGVAHAGDGRVTVEVVGPAGSVAGPGSINCSATAGLCSDDESWPNTQQIPDSFTLTPQRPATGVTVAWTGCGEILSGDRCKGYYGDFRDGDGRGTVVRATFTDTMDPQVEITAPTVGNTQFNGAEDIVVKATASDNHQLSGGVTFAIGSKSITDQAATNGVYEATFRSADFEHGFHDITATAVDASGNDGVSTRSIVVDKRPPELEITGGVQDGAFVADGPVAIDFTVGFDSASIQCALTRGDDEPNWVGCSAVNVTSGTHVASPLTDGEWKLLVRVADGEGNAASTGRRFTLDRTAPTIALGGAPLGYAKQGVATFLRPAVTEANLALFECRAPGGAWQTCSPTAEYAELNVSEGQRVWEFRATDAAGHVGTARLEWVVDGTAPGVTLTGLPAEGATVAPGRFLPEIAATDAASGVDFVECGPSVDGPFEDCPEDAFELGEGDHTFVVHTADRAGNALKVVRRFTVKAPTTPGGDDGPKDDGGDQRPKDDGGGRTRDTPKNDPPAAQPAPAPAPVPAPPVATPRADRTAPALTVGGPKKARSSALRKGLALTIGCSEACTGTVALAGPKGLKATAAVAGAGKVKLKLAAAALRKALRGRKTAKLTLTVTVTDAAGNAATRRISVTATR